MLDTRTVLIGIQARSTSKRFPRKVFERIGTKTMLGHVLTAAQNAQNYINRNSARNGILVKTALLVPIGDEIVNRHDKHTMVIQGPENDVLTRYYEAALREGAHYIVRITADCPLLPGHVISKHITTALMNNFDYVSNVDEDMRTVADGLDCECMSLAMLDWLNTNATEPKDREHVTTLARRRPPEWAKIGCVIGFQDTSSLKISVDTPEDLERVRQEYQKITQALEAAEMKHGKHSIHRF